MSNQMECPDCKVALVAVERKASVSISGLISVALFIIGLICLIFNPVTGIIIWILAAAVGLSKNKKTVLVCHQCKRDVATVD